MPDVKGAITSAAVGTVVSAVGTVAMDPVTRGLKRLMRKAGLIKTRPRRRRRRR